MIMDTSNNNSITWSLDGTRLVIVNSDVLVEECLPKYDMAANLPNFERLLNYYQFKKESSKRNEKTVIYVNPNFQRGQALKLTNIRRATKVPKQVLPSRLPEPNGIIETAVIKPIEFPTLKV